MKKTLSRFLLITAISLMVTACATLKPSTLTNAIAGHATFPSLSMAVQECVADHPEVRSQVVEPFNTLVDKWQLANDLEPEEIVVEVLGGKQHLIEGGAAWKEVKSAIVDAGIDCGPAVKAQVENIETTFDELVAAVNSNERLVYALEWGNLLASVVTGRRGEVVRMEL